MSWIEEVGYEHADTTLKRLYERIKGPDDNVDNIMLAHSLRPHTMTGHMTLYKNVLHHPRNTRRSSRAWIYRPINGYGPLPSSGTISAPENSVQHTPLDAAPYLNIRLLA